MRSKWMKACRVCVGLVLGLSSANHGAFAGERSKAKANPEPDKPVRVALYDTTKGFVNEGTLAALQAGPKIQAERIDNLRQDTLDKFEVLILPITQVPGEEGDWQNRLREWVRAGHGLFVTHSMVGYRSYKPLFPEIAIGTGNPFENRLPYDKELCITSEHPLTKGFALRDRFPMAYYDYVTMAPGPDGVTVMRGVERAGEYAMSSASAVVCGDAGKGRFVACGALIGMVAPRCDKVRPVDGEARLLWNAVHYLAGQGQTRQGEDIGGGVILGASQMEYANNGSLESSTTEGWQLMEGEGSATIAISKEAKEGKQALSLVASAPGKVVLANEKRSYTGERGQPVYPDSAYAMRFWTRAIGAKATAFRPALLIWKEGAAPDAAPEILPGEKTLTAGEGWALQVVTLTPPAGAARVAVAFVMENALAGTGAAFDGLAVNRKDTKGLQGVSVAQVRASCEIPLVAKWVDAIGDRTPSVTSTPENTPITFPQKQLTLPRYRQWHEDWKVVSLDGNWKIMKLNDTTNNPADDIGTRDGYWKKEFDESKWPVRPVPSVWSGEDKEYPDGTAGQGRGSEFVGVGWYRHGFDVPADFAGKRIILRFANVAREITLYVNGKKIGSMVSDNLACEFDLTDTVIPGSKNVLAVRVHAPASPYFRAGYAGIIDEVTLQARPAVYLKKALVTRNVEAATVEIDMTVVNASGSAMTAPLAMKVTPSEASRHLGLAGGKEQTCALGEKTFAPGESVHMVTVKLESPVEWLPENPFLYELRFSAGALALGKARFGLSSFSTKDNMFLLNGRPTRLHGLVFRGVGGHAGIGVENRSQAMNKILLAYKDLGFEVLLPQGQSMAFSDYFRDLCDELGFMVFEWPGLHNGAEGMEPLTKKEFMVPWLEKRYNHPSYIMTSIGNESRNTSFLDVLNRAYDTLTAIDKQKRVICTITGGDPGAVAPKTEVEDFHVYPGEISGHPADMQDLIEDYNEKVWRYYGRMMPVINWEMGGSRWIAEPPDVMKLRSLLIEQPAGYKQALIDQIEGAEAGYHMLLGARWLAIYGMRRYAVDDFEKAKARGYFKSFSTDRNGIARFNPRNSGLELYRLIWCVKGVGEQNRLLGDLLEGYGYNYSPANAHNMRTRDTNGVEVIDSPSFDALMTGGEHLSNLAYDAYKRVNNPVFICAQPFNVHPISGSTLRASLYAINDLRRDAGPWIVRTVVRSEMSGRVVHSRKTEVGSVPSLKRNVFEWTWDIPAEQLAGFYTLEIFLIDKQGGKVLSDNEYRIHVSNRATDLETPIDTHGKRVALYDAGEKTTPPGSLTTAQVVEKLKLPCERITDFSRLAGYDVLIIGRNSMDGAVDRAGDAIRKWLEGGKRLLQFEQSNSGRISYIPQMNVVKSYGGTVADMIVLEHPAFEGLRHTDLWEMWSGRLPEANVGGKQGGLYSCLLGPLNRSVIATGLLAVPRASNKAVQMMVAEVKVGKGVAMISQAEATRRYGEDGVATRYVQNVLRHALSDETAFAEEITGLDISNLDSRRFGYMDLDDLKKGKKTVAAEWAAKMTAEAGVPELGNILFKNVSENAVEVTKDAPLAIEFEKRSQLMFPEWEAQKQKKDVDQRGLQLKRAEAIYLLHTVTAGAMKGEKIGRIVVSYADGSFDEEKLEVGYNIDLAGAKNELEFGRAAGEGYSIARWINPSQEKDLASVRIEVTSPTARVAVAGISNYLTRQKVHD